ncbi:hypothetical protein Q4E93_13315 [Flavitalea sp. BT771]|uniref:hypothetical protein n=1 Tax=Flavitalea sp. BT771 TaxID=3063329 RepID=UPI0026E16E9D|nr:hypothetical protein [Flavitalea sp. BT771]MDO6431578.1 hypothetical protein [Flavitalea sp. BT771]MDV6220486.1 hypothetical protein [Flavitalea sp. BT771]
MPTQARQSIYNLILGMTEADWNYYAPAYNNIRLGKPFVEDITAVDFILRFFQKGGKPMVTEKFQVHTFGRPRAEHTVSVFFFGVLLYHNMVFRHKTFYKGKVNEKFDFFAFIWFITVLAHDFTYYKEADPELLQACQTTDELIAHFDIQYNLLQDGGAHVPVALWNGVQQYYRMRREVRGKVDHGIVAGMLAYDLLVKNRKLQKAERNKEWLWEDYLDKEYAYASTTIAVHNIWLPTEDRLADYIKFNLGHLSEHQKFRFTEGALYHLLSIVDTLDPVKTYGDVRVGNANTPSEALDEPKPDAMTILQNVFLSFPDERTFEMTVSGPLEPDDLIRDGMNLTAFLNVKVTPLEDGIRVRVFSSV